LKSKGWRRYYWLNIKLLAENLLKGSQKLVFTKYFTAKISLPHDKRKRQLTYLEALETLSDLEIYYGKYQLDPLICRKCGFKDKVPHEKMTDVNIAVEMFNDAFHDNFDVAILISADSDLTGLIQSIKKLFPSKQIVATFPPDRFSIELSKHVDKYFVIGRGKIAKSLLPEKVKKKDGYILHKPAKWK
jgi:uncharacterized LabA/DUF88 family protein